MAYTFNNAKLTSELKGLLTILTKNHGDGESSRSKLIGFWKSFDATMQLQSKIAQESKFSFITRPRCESTDSESSLEYEPTLLDKTGNKKYNLEGKTFSGANGKVFRDARLENSGNNNPVVVKEFNIKHSANRVLELALQEHRNLLAAGLESELMYDPEHKKVFVTMPRFEGVTARHAVESRVQILIDAVKCQDEKLAYVTAREMFTILKSTLAAMDEFHKKTNLVHGDGHLGNAIVDETDITKVNLIDMGSCCKNAITAKEYKQSGVSVGGGGFYTAPEIPFVGNVNCNGNDLISFKSDLYSIVTEFVINFVEVDGFSDKATNSESTVLSHIISDFSNWALLHVANSDFVYSYLPKKQSARLFEERKALMQQHGVESAVELRVDFATAIAKIQYFIDRMELAPFGVEPGRVAARIKQFEPQHQHAQA